MSGAEHLREVPKDERPAPNNTDQGNAMRLVAQHGKDLRYASERGRWLVYDGARWKWDDTGEVVRRAKETVLDMHRAAIGGPGGSNQDLVKHALKSESKRGIDAMIYLAQSEPGVPIKIEDLDRNPWLLNVANGTIDLKTGDLRPHDRADLITKLAPVAYDPAAEAPRFLRFLAEIFEGDEDLISFLRRFAGYSLSGSTRERVFAILHGTGKNGKTTLVELLGDALGDYATGTAAETVLAKRSEGINNDVAALKGARFVSAAEVEQDRRLAESKVKQLTGSDTVTARFLYGEPFSFRPEFKLWLSTNNRPIIRGTDDAIWDRIRLVPFARRFAGNQDDPRLPEKLREELPGVLAWMVRGCLEWLQHGLGTPEKVTAATEGYRSEMDVIAGFIEDRCVVDPDAWVKFSDLYESYQAWCDGAGERAEKKRQFGNHLKERGFEPDRGTGNAPIRCGLGLRDDRRPDPNGGTRVTKGTDSYPTVTSTSADTYAGNDESSYPSYRGNRDFGLTEAREGKSRKKGNKGNLGNYASPASGDTRHKGTENKSACAGSTRPAKPSLAAGGSAPGLAEGGNDVVGRGSEEHADLVREREARRREDFCGHGTPIGYPCDDCEIDALFGGGGA